MEDETTKTTTTKNYRYDGIMTALSSVSHGGETKSTTQVLRNEKVVTPTGAIATVPIYSGNALRGILRDCGMRFMLRSLGDPELTLGALHFLFSGGSLTSKPVAGRERAKGAVKHLGESVSTIPISDARDLMDAIPLVSVFGGACGSMIMEGKLQVGKAVPLCQEAAKLIPTKFHLTTMPTVWEYLQTESYTRRDDSKREEMRGLLGTTDRKLLDSMQAKSRQKTIDQEADGDVGAHQQMRYHVQTYAAGTPFYWWLSLKGATEIEWEALASCLVEFAQSPTIGGKGACGHGKVDIKLDEWVELKAAVSTTELGKPVGQAYRDHLASHRDDILGVLKRI